MPVSYRIEPVRRLILNVAEGPITGPDLLATREAMGADPAFDPSFDQLVDLTAADLTGLRSPDVRTLAEGSRFAEHSRRAVVVSGTLEYGLARMFGMLSNDKGRIEVFTDRTEAEAWLLSDPCTEPSRMERRHEL